MRPYLLIYRAILVNVIGFALLAIAAVKGWIAELLAADVTDLVIVIFVVFLVGLAICAEKIVTTAATLTGCSARRRICPARPDFISTARRNCSPRRLSRSYSAASRWCANSPPRSSSSAWWAP